MYRLLFLLFFASFVAADDDWEYDEAIVMLRREAEEYAGAARDLGLHSPFRYNVNSYTWPDRFARYFSGYADFREGFDILLWCCDDQFNSSIKRARNEERECLEKLQCLKDPIERSSWEYVLERARKNLAVWPQKQATIQNVLQRGWSQIQQEFDVLYARFSHLKDPYLYFHRGFLFLDKGHFAEAALEMEKVVHSGDMTKVLAKVDKSTLEFELDAARTYSELGEYSKAIELLSEILRKNPEEKEAYFERAAAYFELGKFDLSLEDYLKQRDESVFSYIHDPELFAFSKGFLDGAKIGGTDTAVEFVPSLLGTLQGLGGLLWAAIEHPIETPKQYAEAAIEFCNFLRVCDKKELAQIVVPELYQLFADWENLTYTKRGELIGYTLGKYGLDVVLITGLYKGIKVVKSYQKLKKAEKLCTLETLARSPESREALIEAAAHHEKRRQEWFQQVKIEMDKQGKHIPSHRNFDSNGTKSIWTYPNPEEKIKKLAGKGQKTRGIAGEAGYQERVDCGEIIGYFVEENGEKIPTTMATIHYSKKGAHIVPARPKPNIQGN